MGAPEITDSYTSVKSKFLLDEREIRKWNIILNSKER